MANHFDVIVVGAGLVGLTLTCLLAKENLRIALIEAGDMMLLPKERGDYPSRVSAINPACQEIFTQLNIWHKIVASQHYSPFEKMFVWDHLGKGEIHFDCTKIAKPSLGHIIENAVLNQALLQELRDHPQVAIFSNRQPIAMSLTAKKITLKCMPLQAPQSPTEVLTAELVAGADGASSWVRQYANIACYNWSYSQNSLVTTVSTEMSHERTAWQCFLPEGPLALLPLCEENICSIVWSASPDKIKELQELDAEAFNRTITNAFEFKLGRIERISAFATFPLNMQHAKRYVRRPGIAVLGDAAHTIHPLAGQGLNLGFGDALVLAEKIVMAKNKFNDCGEYSLLRKYERERKSANWEMIMGMEVFKRLFGSSSHAAIYLRGLGLDWVNKTSLIKDQFINRAIAS